MLPDNDERRPADHGAPPNVVDLDAADSTRCWLCGRPLRADASVRLGIGPVCWERRTGGAA